MGWELREALICSGLWTSEAEVNNYFSNINCELDDAFQKGILKKDEKFQLVDSAGGYTNNEILWILSLSWRLIFEHISLNNYIPGCIPSNTSDIVSTEDACLTTHIDLFNYHSAEYSSVVNGVIKSYYSAISLIYIFMSILSFIVIVLSICYSIFKHKKLISCWVNVYVSSFLILCFWIFAFIYSFGIVWFSAFLTDSQNLSYQCIYYSSALPAFLVIIFILSISVIYHIFMDANKKYIVK